MGKKVTLISTVFNEEKSIYTFLESIKNQTKKPDEIIIVDAMSSDRTREIIKDSKLNVKLIKKRGNRSLGRNTAIKAATHEVIAVTDAGCILDTHWLERITTIFHKGDIDVVAGFYKPKTNCTFEKCLSTYTCVMEDKLNIHNFLPSSRSVAFKKSAWEKVNGYPERLDTCEDLVFAKKLKQKGLKFVTVKNAIVYWPQQKSIIGAAKQFFNYAKGDGKAHYIRKTTPLLFGRYILGLFFVVFILYSKGYYFFMLVCMLLIFYILWAIFKNYRYVKRWQAFFYLPILQFVSDVAVISGTIIGLGESVWDIQNK